MMRRLRGLLSEDGLLVMAVPNFAGREAFAFKENWFHLDVPYHRFHFSKPSLRRLATDAGLQDCPEQRILYRARPLRIDPEHVECNGLAF